MKNTSKAVIKLNLNIYYIIKYIIQIKSCVC